MAGAYVLGAILMDAAAFLKSRQPHSEVAVKDLQSDPPTSREPVNAIPMRTSFKGHSRVASLGRYLLQSSSASRLTAAQVGIFILSQSEERPERATSWQHSG